MSDCAEMDLSQTVKGRAQCRTVATDEFKIRPKTKRLAAKTNPTLHRNYISQNEFLNRNTVIADLRFVQII